MQDVPDPKIEFATDAIVRITATGLCGSDLHLYKPLASMVQKGDILGHEGVGVVEEVGRGVGNIAVGDRVVVPFNISCGECFLCERGLQSQCETTQNRGDKKGATLFGYTSLYGGVPGAQAEYLRVPFADYGPVVVPENLSDEEAVLLADVLPTAWQAVSYADVREGGTVAVFGLGPIGQMCCRIAKLKGAHRVIGIDRVPARLEMARRHGIDTIDFSEVEDVVHVVEHRTQSRGADSVIDAVGMEAEGSAVDTALTAVKAQADRFPALRDAMACVRRGGTLSIVGVYVGALPSFPLGDLFDRQVTLRMGQANVRRWTREIVAVAQDGDDPLKLADFVTHVMPLEEAPDAYRLFQERADGAVKIVFRP